MQTVPLEHVQKEELSVISTKRRKHNQEEVSVEPSNIFGIALSGGGIRSATINFGLMEIFSRCGVLPFVDYLSTVSGGGYTGGYIHAKLNECTSEQNSPFEEIFSQEDREHLMRFGRYLTPGKGLAEIFTGFRLAASFLFSLLMNWVWLLSLFLVLFFFAMTVTSFIYESYWFSFAHWLFVSVALVLFAHFFLHGLRHLRLWSSNVLYSIEAVLLVGLIIYALHQVTMGHQIESPWYALILSSLIFFFTGFFANPNVLTMHRFYRDRLAAAYLKMPAKSFQRLKLCELAEGKAQERRSSAPYPLINTCLNLSGETDQNFKGAKACDYFLLSPLYCGSKSTGYISTGSPGYKNMTLSTAVAISGAAVNPNMGARTNRPLAFLMTLLNLRLGYWSSNPGSGFLPRISWWPYYNIMELLGRADTNRRRVSISDGGHIENLAVYELLRRKCRLIIAVDASADPDYSFSDLKNLLIRARNELGVAITFRQDPETCIRPAPSRGFSESHFVIADIAGLSGTGEGDNTYSGLLVYVKSSLIASKRFKRIESDSYLYKTYHPSFPHESTADQFFDKAQWKAYYHLGRFMAGDLLGIDVTDDRYITSTIWRANKFEQLYQRFDAMKDCDDLRMS